MAISFLPTIFRVELRKLCGLHFNRHLCTSTKTSPSSTVIKDEVEKFTSSSSQWWNGDELKLLHSMNTIRVPFIREGILSINGQTTKKSLPLDGYKIIDVGCGGGILSEPLARLGATVTGLDPGYENIEVASQHGSLDENIKNKLNYVCDTVENFTTNTTDKYDALVCSEVIEHVANPQAFVSSCVELTKEGGSLFFTTINRTALSYVSAILAAEYIFRFIPRGTHDWNKFITPKELSDMLRSLNCRIVSIEGYMYNPVAGKWYWCGNSGSMYALHAVK